MKVEINDDFGNPIDLLKEKLDSNEKDEQLIDLLFEITETE